MSTVAQDLAALPNPVNPSSMETGGGGRAGQSGQSALDQPGYHPHDYHRIQDAISTLIQDVRDLVPAMSHSHKSSIAAMLGANLESTGLPVELTMTEVSKQYQIVLKLQDQLLNDVGGILSDASAKEISALVTAMNNTISLFLRSQKEMNHLEEMQNMREAIVYALKESPLDVQENFFRRLDEHRALTMPRIGR